MSGTSIDGIDLSVVNTNGVNLDRLGINYKHDFSKETKLLLCEALNDPIIFLNDKNKTKNLDILIAKDFYSAIENGCKINEIKPDLIGFSGQTIFHCPQKKKTIQLGDPHTLSKLTNLPIIHDFRSNDIKNGGQGAPLAPIYHKFIIQELKLKLPSVILNIGGISNLTWWDGINLIGFDTGPGNSFIDTYMKKIFNLDYDYNGQVALSGSIHKNTIKKFLDNKYFNKLYPKSLDKNTFKPFFRNIDQLNLCNFDLIATLTELTVQTIIKGLSILPKMPLNLVVVGGGKNNKAIINGLKKNLSINICTSNKFGIDGDYVESELIAFLAARSFYKLPISFPNTTGIKKPLLGGKKIIPKHL